MTTAQCLEMILDCLMLGRVREARQLTKESRGRVTLDRYPDRRVTIVMWNGDPLLNDSTFVASLETLAIPEEITFERCNKPSRVTHLALYSCDGDLVSSGPLVNDCFVDESITILLKITRAELAVALRGNFRRF